MKALGIFHALFDYEAQTVEELSLQQGDVLILTDDSDVDWWYALLKPGDVPRDVTAGLVPSNYVEKVFVEIIFISLASCHF